MFGGGWTEMFIIGIVAFMVIGPKDLPVVMRKVGRLVGTVRRMGTEFQRELNKTTGLDQITDLRRSLTEPLRQTSEEIAREFNRQTPTGVEPSGVMKPLDPKVESVYDQIAATSGVTPTAGAAPAAVTTMPKPRRAAKPKLAEPVVAEPTPAAVKKPPQRKPAAAKSAATAAVTAPAKPAVKKSAPAKSAAAEAVPATVTPASKASAPKAPAKPRTKKA
jgi:sec-independent protein translocase protein TatB